VSPPVAGLPLLLVLDGLLALLLLEAVVLLWWRRRTGAGLPGAALLTTLLAGGGIVLAWRASLAGAPSPWVAAALALAGAAHLLDLARRWQRRR
jgi:hypothetical protein